ncbi:MAG TPA: carboxypeptidase-like regulatory domain-containing protein, partial [Conexibacter sp.]|nr:carboxypeptidase-like regulatory domain-containing protein [Conexibacter sp.]
DVVLADACAGGGALDVALAGGRSFLPGVRGSLTFHSPPGTHIDSWTVWRSLAVAPPGGSSSDYVAAISERGSAIVQQGCSSAQSAPFGCLTVGSETDPLDPANRVDRAGTPVLSALELWVGCRSAVCDEPVGAAPARLRLHGSRLEVHDLSAPERPQLSGTLLAPGPISGSATLVVESADEGGGIAETTVSLDGEPWRTSAPAGTRGTCREPYTVLQPCPSAAARAFTLDTTTLPDGPHTVGGAIVDAAGNAVLWGPVAFEVRQPARDDGDDDGRRGGGGPPPGDGGRGGGQAPIPPPPPPVVPSPPTGNGAPAVERPRLRLLDRSLSRRPGRGVRITGTLHSAGGVPIVGARLTVLAHQLGTGDQRGRALATVTTDSTGRFSFVVRGHGAERYTVAFAPAEGAAATAAAAATVRAPATLSITRSQARLRRGQTVVLRGRLRGFGAAARGAVVELQAIVSGDWRTVGTVRADAQGRYAWRYRFVSVTRDTLFTFRALVRRTPGWPWPELRTRRIAVRVDAVDQLR